MRNKTLLAAVIVFAASAVYGIWWGVDTHRELKKLREQNKEFVESTKPSGGAERDIEKPPNGINGVYLFPLRDRDFKVLSDKFGWRISPKLKIEKDHDGLDIVPSVQNAEVVAISDGTVLHNYRKPGEPHPDGGFYRGHDVYGCMIHIRHANGVESIYAHLSDTAVHENETVVAGQPIGRTGDTGQAYGEHLHLEIIIRGRPVNPLLYLEVPRETEN